jgi:glycosyltransferase involved in cell wall biosynthesis
LRFSLIIPCYNEAANLPSLLERCRQMTRRRDIQIVLVDNGSTDASPLVLSNLLPEYPGCCGIRVERNQGYGFGILAGLRVAGGEILGWTHADLQTDPNDTMRGLALFDKWGLGTFVKGKRHGRPFADSLFTMGMSAFETMLLGKLMRDINAQPTMFSRTFFESWDDAPHDFSLDLYAYYMACRSHLQIERIPVKFGERAHGVSSWNVNWDAKRRFIRRNINYGFELRRRRRS